MPEINFIWGVEPVLTVRARFFAQIFLDANVHIV